MSSKIRCIKVLITPFHKEAISSVLRNSFNDEETLTFLSTYMSGDNSVNNAVIPKEFTFSKLELLNPYKLRKKMSYIDYYIEESLSKYIIDEEVVFVSGSDRELFCQIFINHLKKKSNKAKVIAVDEGIGFYSERTFKDAIFTRIYKFYSSLFLKIQFDYIKPLGANKLTDIVYLRNLKGLKFKSQQIIYKEFFVELQDQIQNYGHLRGVLLFTPPEDLIAVDKKKEIIDIIIRYFKDKNVSIVIKPHPRENLSTLGSLDKSNVKILRQDFPGELLPYENFEWIFNFESSIIFNLLENSLIRDRIVTIARNPLKLNNVFKETLIINLNRFSLDMLGEVNYKD